MSQTANKGLPPIGHNSASRVFIDPGPATEFVDRGPVGVRRDLLDPKKVEEFYDACRSHGSEAVRQRALSNAEARVRADPDVSHQEFRVFAQIVSRVRQRFGYHCEPMQTAAHFSASDPKNIRRPIDNLIELGFLRRLDLPRPAGGRPMPCLTVVCTPEDRSGETISILARAAKQRSIPCDEFDEDANRHHDDLQTVTMTPSPAPNRHVEGLQTVTMTGANRHHDAHTVKGNVKEGSEVLASAKRNAAPKKARAIDDEIKPAKRKGRPTGKRPWEWVHQSERDDLSAWCEEFADGRGWTREFLAERLRAFELHQRMHKLVSADWKAGLEQWLSDPRFQPRPGRSSNLAAVIDRLGWGDDE